MLQTGTLTENRMTVVEGWIAGKKYDQVPQPGDLPPGFFDMFQASIAVNSSVRGLASTQAWSLHCLVINLDQWQHRFVCSVHRLCSAMLQRQQCKSKEMASMTGTSTQ